MIRKIISGGQTGAERAALDMAIKFDIRYGGWIPKGRKIGDDFLPDKYQLQEMPTDSYQAAIEKTVLESDGTLIFTRGGPTDEIICTLKMLQKHKGKMFSIDLNMPTSYDAASLILSWMKLQNMKKINVTGPRTSKDGKVYADVFRILEMAYVINKIEGLKFGNLPKTVEEAIDSLGRSLSLKDKATIANMADDELSILRFNLGEYIRNEFGLWSDNDDLMKSCCLITKRNNIHQDEASSIIIKQLWEQLQETHRFRVVR